MSTTDRWGRKLVLTRIGPEDFWLEVKTHYAGADARKWKLLAMLALRVDAGWSLDMIGEAFRHDRGHVCRALKELIRELKDTFRWIPEPQEGEGLEISESRFQAGDSSAPSPSPFPPQRGRGDKAKAI